jgi:hypothetical protein
MEGVSGIKSCNFPVPVFKCNIPKTIITSAYKILANLVGKTVSL